MSESMEKLKLAEKLAGWAKFRAASSCNWPWLPASLRHRGTTTKYNATPLRVPDQC